MYTKFMASFININQYRSETLIHLSKLKAVSTNKTIWTNYILNKINTKTPKSILDLGDDLSEIFSSANNKSRTQQGVSLAGQGWEAIVCWYLNLIFWNTSIITVMGRNSTIPPVIKNCLSVIIDNKKTNTESDLIMFSIPNTAKLGFFNLNKLNDHLIENIHDLKIAIVQCKTNWNENAQIPMLWDIIYNSAKNNILQIPGLSIGSEGVSISDINDFKYCFMTMPSNRVEKFKPHSMPVSRVRNLSGGNYWGWPTKNGVALSIKEIFYKLFPEQFTGGIENHIKRNLMDHYYWDWFSTWNWDESKIN